MKTAIIIAILVCGLLGGRAQSGRQLCLLHTDKAFYVSGEVMWFKVYLPPGVRHEAGALQVSLLSADGVTGDYFFLPLTPRQSSAHGHFQVPYEWSSGVYRLTVSLFDELSQRSVILQRAAIPIYNDLQTTATVPTAASSPAAESVLADDLVVTIELDQTGDKAGQPRPVTIQVRDREGRPVAADLSVAVTDWTLAGDAVLDWPTLHSDHRLAESMSLQAAPGLTFVGTLSREDNGYPLSSTILGGFSLADGKVYFTKAEKGEFRLDLPAFEGRQRIQLVDYEHPDIAVDLQPTVDPTALPALPLTSGVLAYLDLSRKRKKIYQLYTAVETDIPAMAPRPDLQYPPADRSLRPDDYQRFSNLAVFCQEVAQHLWFRQTAAGYEARLYNPNTKQRYQRAPLFLIDGKVTRDADFVGRLDVSLIERLDLYFKLESLRRHFPAFGNDGLVVITTKAGELPIPPSEESDVLPISGLQAPVEFVSILPATPNDGTGLPALRPQRYWNPSLKTGMEGSVQLLIPATEDRSTFRLEVVAQAADGRRGRGSAMWKVD